MPTYQEMLRDPRWQKKRLQIIERDGFACRKCSSTTKTLAVHHNYYLGFGVPPWECPDLALFTLCEDCHKEEELCKNHIDEMLVFFLRQAGALNSDIGRITTIFCDLTERTGGLAIIQEGLNEIWTREMALRKK